MACYDTYNVDIRTTNYAYKLPIQTSNSNKNLFAFIYEYTSKKIHVIAQNQIKMKTKNLIKCLLNIILLISSPYSSSFINFLNNFLWSFLFSEDIWLVESVLTMQNTPYPESISLGDFGGQNCMFLQKQTKFPYQIIIVLMSIFFVFVKQYFMCAL